MDDILRDVYDHDDDCDWQPFVSKVPLGLSLMYYFVPRTILYEHRQIEQVLGRALYLASADFRPFTPIGSLRAACDQMKSEADSRFIWTSYCLGNEVLFDEFNVICDQYLNIIDPCNLYSTLQNSLCVT